MKTLQLNSLSKQKSLNHFATYFISVSFNDIYNYRTKRSMPWSGWGLPKVWGRHWLIWRYWWKVKVKWSRYRPGVAQRVGRGIALLFHDRGTRRGWVVSSTPQSNFTLGKERVPILQEVGWAPGRSGRVENLVPTGIRSRTVQPVVRRYTDWATQPTIEGTIWGNRRHKKSWKMSVSQSVRSARTPGTWSFRGLSFVTWRPIFPA